MGLLDWLRQHLGGTPCSKLVSYDGSTLRIGGVKGTVGPVSVSVAEVETHPEVLRGASEIVQAMDNYQYLMCRQYRSQKKGPLKDWYGKQMATGLTYVMALQAALVSFTADPAGEWQSLQSVTKDVTDALLKAAGKPTPFPKARAKVGPKQKQYVSFYTYKTGSAGLRLVTPALKSGVRFGGLPEPDANTLKRFGTSRQDWRAATRL